MKFKAIIHNLIPTDKGFKECQNYNKLIGNRPMGSGSLTTKIENLRLWELECKHSLELARGAVK